MFHKFLSVKWRWSVVLTSLRVLSTSSGRSSGGLFSVSSGNFGKSLKLLLPSIRLGSSSRMGFFSSSSQRISSNDLFSCTKNATVVTRDRMNFEKVLESLSFICDSPNYGTLIQPLFVISVLIQFIISIQIPSFNLSTSRCLQLPC